MTLPRSDNCRKITGSGTFKRADAVSVADRIKRGTCADATMNVPHIAQASARRNFLTIAADR